MIGGTVADVTSVGSQRAYGEYVNPFCTHADNSLHTNCTALAGLQNKDDVLLLSEEKRECLILTIRAAAWLVRSIGNGGQATNAEYGQFSASDPRVSLADDDKGNHYFRTLS